MIFLAVLPEAFSEGYLHSLQTTIGTSNFQTVLALAESVAQTEKSTEDFETILSFTWLRQSSKKPVHYALLRYIQTALETTFSIKRSISITYRVGTLWWIGQPLLSTQPEFESLSSLMVSKPKDTISNIKQVLGHMTNKPIDVFYKELYISIASVFINTFVDHSGIQCKLDISENRLEISVINCPFCDNSIGCQVFLGIFNSMNNWIIDRSPGIVYQIKKDDDNHHKFIIDLTIQ